MINISFRITNPWYDNWQSLWSTSGMLTKNLGWEAQISTGPVFVSFDFSWRVRQDHAGVCFEIGLLGYEFCAEIYDGRHWDYENKQWLTYDDHEFTIIKEDEI